MTRLGRIYSSIVFKNISVIIAAGIINVLFGQNGWFPNERFSQFIDPLYTYVIPLLLAFTGGKITGGHRGGLVASLAVLGLIQSSDIPMIIGAIFFSPPIGSVFSKLEKAVKGYFPIGSELLLTNIIDAMVSILLLFLMCFIIGPILNNGILLLNRGLITFIQSDWLPFVSFVIEPAKVLFLNNISNHGIVGPLGVQQTKELGKSIFFLLEANPGPGLGMLLACFVRGSNEEKVRLKSTIAIQSIGGIHEVYFPYVLSKPILFLSVIAGGFTGVFLFSTFQVGLVSTASPASILFIFFLTPKHDFIFLFIGIALSAFVSFLLSFLFLKQGASFIDQTEENEQSPVIPNQTQVHLQPIRRVIVACDGGMASSSMEAAILRKKLQSSPLDLVVDYSSIDEIPKDTDVIICHRRFSPSIASNYPGILNFGLHSLSNESEYTNIIKTLEEMTDNK